MPFRGALNRYKLGSTVNPVGILLLNYYQRENCDKSKNLLDRKYVHKIIQFNVIMVVLSKS